MMIRPRSRTLPIAEPVIRSATTGVSPAAGRPLQSAFASHGAEPFCTTSEPSPLAESAATGAARAAQTANIKARRRIALAVSTAGVARDSGDRKGSVTGDTLPRMRRVGLVALIVGGFKACGPMAATPVA